MNTEKLYEFLILSKTLSFSRAASTMYISQSILTRHIKDMEEELGVTLFFRNTHGVALTEAGKRFVHHAKNLIEKCNDAANLVHISNLPIRGSIRIGCSPEIAYASHVKMLIARFTERYPGIHLDFIIESNGIPDKLLENYDFIFTPCEYSILPSGTIQHQIHSHGTYLLLPPGHSLMSRSLIQLSELAGETIIVPFLDEPFGPYAKNWMLTDKCTHGKASCLGAPNLSTTLFMVSIGKGIAIVPRYVKNMVPKDTFMIGISNSESRFNEYLYYNSTRENGAAKLFYEEFRSTH